MKLIRKHQYILINTVILLLLVILSLIVYIIHAKGSKANVYRNKSNTSQQISEYASRSINLIHEDLAAGTFHRYEDAVKNIKIAKNKLELIKNYASHKSKDNLLFSKEFNEYTQTIYTLADTIRSFFPGNTNNNVLDYLITFNQLSIKLKNQEKDLQKLIENKLEQLHKSTAISITYLLILMVILFILILYQLFIYNRSRNKIENQLLKSRRKYRDLVISSPDLIWEIDKEVRFTYLSPNFKEILGYDSISSLYKTPFHFTDDKEISEMKRKIEETIQAELIFNGLILKVIHANGKKITLEVNGNPIFDKNNILKGYRGIARNITRRLKTEQALLEEKANLSALLNASNDAMALIQEDSFTLAVNDAFAKRFEKAKNEIIHVNLKEFINEETINQRYKKIQKMFEKGTAVEFIDERNGRIYKNKTVPIFDESNKISRIAVHSRDITKEQKAEIALRKSEKKFRQIFNNAPIGIFRTSLDGKFLEVNPATAKMFGYASPEEVYKKINDIGKQIYADPTARKEILKKIKNTEDTLHIETLFKKNDGECFNVLLTVYPVRGDNLFITHLEGLIQDITAKKEAEEYMKTANIKLENEVQKRTSQLYEINADLTSEIEIRKEIESQLESSRAFISNLMNQIPDPVYVKNRNLQLIHVNEAYAKIFGKSENEIIGKTTFELFPEEKAKEISLIDKLLFKSRRPLEKNEVIYNNSYQKRIYLTKTAFTSDQTGEELLVGIMRDITDRKKAEEKMKENYEFIKILLDTIPNPVFYKDTKGVYLGANKAFEKFIGYSQKELIGKSTKEISPVNLSPEYIEKDKKLLLKGGQQAYEWKVTDAAGWEREVIFNKAAFYNAEGNIGGLLGIMTDITERKELERQIVKEKELLRRSFISISDGIFLVDSKHNIIQCNEAFAKIVGKKTHEIIGKKLYSVVHGTEYPITSCASCNAIIKGKNGKGEKWEPHLNKYIYITADPLFNEDSFEFSIHTIRDITEEKLAQKALKESEEKFRRYVESAPIGIFLADQQGSYLDANPEALDMLSYTKEELLTKSIEDIIPEFEKENVRASFNNLVKYGNSNHETKLKNSQGQSIDVYVNAVKLKENRYLGFTLDITDRKKAEENIFNSLQREKELSQIKTRFISMVSHEFRTPLANIYSNTQLLERFGLKWNEEKKVKSFKRILNSVKILNSMLDDVSLFGKKQSGQLKLNRSSLNFEAFLKSVVDETLANFDIQRKVLIIEKNKTGIINSDQFLLRHVITNLLNNALKYSENDKPVYLRIEKSKIHINIEVEDYGRGIPEKEMNHIFEPFYRASNVENIQGTGLGMAIVKHASDLLNGKLKIESYPGKGTKVWFSFPVY